MTLPLSLPGLGAGLLLCFVLAAGSYVTPQLLGGSRDALFGNLIYDTIMSQLNWPMGATLSIVLFVLLGLVAAAYNSTHRFSQPRMMEGSFSLAPGVCDLLRYGMGASRSNMPSIDAWGSAMEQLSRETSVGLAAGQIDKLSGVFWFVSVVPGREMTRLLDIADYGSTVSTSNLLCLGRRLERTYPFAPNCLSRCNAHDGWCELIHLPDVACRSSWRWNVPLVWPVVS